MEKDFSIARTPEGNLLIKSKDGQVVAPSPENPAFNQFMTWLSRPEHRSEQLIANTTNELFQSVLVSSHFFFCEIMSLIEHLKTTNELIFANVFDSPDKSFFLTPANERIFLGHSYKCLRIGVHKKRLGLKDHRLAEEDTNGFVPYESNIYVTDTLWKELILHLGYTIPRHGTESEVRNVTTRPQNLAFLFLDVSGFSEEVPANQRLIISSILKLTDTSRYWERCPIPSLNLKPRARLCIGDGYIFVFDDPAMATYFAGFLAQLIEIAIASSASVEFHFRMGVHFGEVFHFWDPGRNNWNYIGKGINGANRVISVIGEQTDDIVFVSAEVRQVLQNSEQYLSKEIIRNLQNRGRRKDKHNKNWRVYELNHSGLMAGNMPGVID